MLPKPVTAESAKPAVQQFWEMLNWGSRLVTTPSDYQTYGLFLRGRTRGDALRYLSGPRALEMLERLNPEPEILEDKLRYSSHFGGLGLPVPETVAVIGSHAHSGSRPSLRGAKKVEDYVLAALDRGEHLVIKQVDGMQGSGVAVLTSLRREGEKLRVVFSNRQERSLSEFARALEGSGAVWLVQHRLPQHETMESLNPTSVNTTRLATFRRRDGSVDITYAVLRIGRLTGQIDGYNAGGVAVRVDPETGRLAHQGQQKAKYSVGLVDRHPDSGVLFSDVTLPYWDEALRLARRFAEVAGDNRFVGWDIAITPEGPVFIEGNHNWDVQFAQLGSSGLLAGDGAEYLRSEAGIEFDTTRLPRPRPLRAFQLLRSSR